MELLESPKNKALRILKGLFPVLVLLLALTAFILGISRTSGDTLSKEQETLSRALTRGAVSCYAQTGRYPESLSQLLSGYGITYDEDKFVIDYVPAGSNLFPQISVIALQGKKGGPG